MLLLIFSVFISGCSNKKESEINNNDKELNSTEVTKQGDSLGNNDEVDNTKEDDKGNHSRDDSDKINSSEDSGSIDNKESEDTPNKDVDPSVGVKKQNNKEDNDEVDKGKDIYETLFNGLNEKDVNKISTVFKNQSMVDGFSDEFDYLDLNFEIISSELLSEDDNKLTFEVDVKIINGIPTNGYVDNITTYIIGVDSDTNEIDYFEIVDLMEL